MRAATRGDLAPVFGIDAALQRLEVRDQGLSLASARSAAAQQSLATVQQAAGNLGLDLGAAVSRGDPVSTSALQATASGVLEAVVNALNTSFGGRTLFSGAGQDGPALAGAGQIIAEVANIVGSAADAASAVAAVDAWFDTPGGGFETIAYLGSTTDAAAVEIADETRLSYLPRADDAALRDTMKALALIAVAPFATTAGDREALLAEGAGQLVAAEQAVTGLRAALGSDEERIAQAKETTEAERNALARSRNDLVGVDQYEAATRFAEVEGQLQSLYTVTARLSGLSLTNYLR
ncbi:flagellin [Halovulum sp. GXIMD14794]